MGEVRPPLMYRCRLSHVEDHTFQFNVAHVGYRLSHGGSFSSVVAHILDEPGPDVRHRGCPSLRGMGCAEQHLYKKHLKPFKAVSGRDVCRNVKNVINVENIHSPFSSLPYRK